MTSVQPPTLSNKKTSDKKEISKTPIKIVQPALTTTASKAITSQGKKDLTEDSTTLETYYYGKINGRFYNHNAIDVDFKANVSLNKYFLYLFKII